MEALSQNFNPSQVAEIKLSYKHLRKPSECPGISSSRDAYNILFYHWDQAKLDFIEQFKVLLLSRANKVLGIFEASSGSSAGVLVDPKLIMAAAIKSNASGIILAHNHPSGNLQPSESDKTLTRKIKNGAAFLDVLVHDHIVLSSEGYFSFADEGLL
jgi:DNA repair protein RadC